MSCGWTRCFGRAAGPRRRGCCPRVATDLQALARARLALQGEAKGVTALIEAVPQARADDAGLAYDRFIWRMKRDLYDDALELILDRSTSAEALGRPEAWADRRAILARWLMRQGRPAEAYRVAANHHLTDGGGASDYADLEFLAGFIALRRLDDPSAALSAFPQPSGRRVRPRSAWPARTTGSAARKRLPGKDGTASYPGGRPASDRLLRPSGRGTAGPALDAGLLADAARARLAGRGLPAIFGPRGSRASAQGGRPGPGQALPPASGRKPGRDRPCADGRHGRWPGTSRISRC